MGCEKFFSQFSNKDLSFKIEDSNAFKPNLNLSKLGINLKETFWKFFKSKTFFLKNSLNIQIQTKANGRL
jgi:hypothetical protein